MLATKSKSAESQDGTRAGALSGQESSVSCVITKGSKFDGNFSSEDSIRLDGIVTGDLICNNRLVIGETGRVEGKVKSKDAIIMGIVEGELVVYGTLQLKSSASILGKITARYLTVEEGARYNGDCRIGEEEHKKS